MYIAIALFGGIVLTIISRSLLRFFRRNVISLAGPPSASLVAGNLGQLFDPRGMKYHEEYVEKYGTAFQVHGLFGEKQIFLSDPQAISTMLNDPDNFPETDGFTSIGRLIFGSSLFATTGQQHRTQRKMLNPVFTTRNIRDLTGPFQSIAQKMRLRLISDINAAPGNQKCAELDVYSLITRTALDMIGLGGVGYDFGALEGTEDPYSAAAHHLLPTLSEIAFVTPFLHLLLKAGPRFFRRLVVLCTPLRSVQRFRKVVDTMDSTAWKIFNEKKQKLMNSNNSEDNSLDMISYAIKSNIQNPRLTDEEIVAQISTLVFAAFDTTSGAIVRTLQVLADYPEIQSRLREEIVKTVNANGGLDLDYDMLENLPYLNAICAETLRLYPPVSWMSRTARINTILPLARSIKSANGRDDIESLPIEDGTTIYISIQGVNRDKGIWGEDAHEYRPERWLQPTLSSVSEAKIPSLWSSVLSFSAGPRGCIGFRFSLLEMKVVLSTILQTLEFRPSGKTIDWQLSLTVAPHVKIDGELRPGLPLKVSPVEI